MNCNRLKLKENLLIMVDFGLESAIINCKKIINLEKKEKMNIKNKNDAIEKLFELGIDFTVDSFIDCVLKEDLKVIKKFIDAGFDLNSKNDMGWNALLTATKNGKIDSVEFLISQGADINKKNNSGWTSLMWAAYAGHVKIVEVLIKAGADIDAKGNNGLSVLDCAIDSGLGCRWHNKNLEKLLDEKYKK